VRWFGSAFRNPYCYLPCSRRAVDDAGSRRPAPRNQMFRNSHGGHFLSAN
jgi:hypothetical protein